MQKGGSPLTAIGWRFRGDFARQLPRKIGFDSEHLVKNRIRNDFAANASLTKGIGAIKSEAFLRLTPSLISIDKTFGAFEPALSFPSIGGIISEPASFSLGRAIGLG